MGGFGGAEIAQAQPFNVRAWATWDAGTRAAVDSMDDSGLGYMIFWDEREHGVDLWSVENATPGADIGQWVSPVRTRRASCQYLVNTYRSDRSYPGFFNADADIALAGQQDRKSVV